MAWDASLHKTIKTVELPITHNTTIIVEKYSYDGGAERIKIGKQIKKASGEISHAPMSGIEIPHAAAVADAIKQLAEN